MVKKVLKHRYSTLSDKIDNIKSTSNALFFAYRLRDYLGQLIACNKALKEHPIQQGIHSRLTNTIYKKYNTQVNKYQKTLDHNFDLLNESLDDVLARQALPFYKRWFS